MHRTNTQPWQHEHIFGQDRHHGGERKTFTVVIMTVSMMVIEITAGLVFGSMALLADGLHMASHTVALGINVFAYAYARRRAKDERFSFGTGKVNALGGFAGAVLLGVFAFFMAWESAVRIANPVTIAFDQAIFVAVIGLMVNGISVWILNIKEDREPGHDGHHHHDHNLRSAYLHVLADALTSFLAIFALLAAKFFGLIWMDPLMGIAGAILIVRWSFGLLRVASDVLLDKQAPKELRQRIRENIEKDNDSRITDLHVWTIGPNIYSAIISVVAQFPREPEEYKKLLPPALGLHHVTIEVCKCKADEIK